jgi:hypothetical protein
LRPSSLCSPGPAQRSTRPASLLSNSVVQRWSGGRISRPWFPRDIKSHGLNSSRSSRNITFLKVSWIER